MSQPFLEHYKPYCKVAIGEAMVKFKGMSSLRQTSHKWKKDLDAVQ
jgi:hypothetical protein